jgi:hypothetical protein
MTCHEGKVGCSTPSLTLAVDGSVWLMPCPSSFTCWNDLDQEKRVNKTFCDCVRMSSGMLQLLGCYQFCVCLCYMHV